MKEWFLTFYRTSSKVLWISSHQAVQSNALPTPPAMTEEEEKGHSLLCTLLSAALFVPFWQPHLNVRTRSSAVFRHASNAALSKKDSQCLSSTSQEHKRSLPTFKCRGCFFHKVTTFSSSLLSQIFGLTTFPTKEKLLERCPKEIEANAMCGFFWERTACYTES